MSYGFVDNLTKEQADYVRYLRVERGATWRGVAGLIYTIYGIGDPGNQLAGVELCKLAAEHFGEDYTTGEWN